MLTVRQILIMGWLILLLSVFVAHGSGSVRQAQSQVDNAPQAVEMYQP